MKALVALSIISLILLSGCTKQTIEKEPSETAAQQTTQQTEVTERTMVDVTKISEESSAPKTYHVNIIQGIGVREGSG